MSDFNFTPFPILKTERLVLRQLIKQDVKDILFLRSDERILKYIDITKALTKNDALEYINKMNAGIEQNEFILWGINTKTSSHVIGTICLWNLNKEQGIGEIGYLLHPDFQGQGLMQESIEKVIEYGFKTMRLKLIEAVFNENNLKSLYSLKRNNFRFDRQENNMLTYNLKNPM